MNQNPSKMYKLLDALYVCGSPENSSDEEIELNIRDKQIDDQGSKKCDDLCVDCFLTFCRK